MMQRILVIGAASLVGSHLCDRLLADGHEVIAVDDFTTGSFANVAHLKREPRFAFVEHDVTRKFDAHVDGIFHLALPSSRRACEGDPVRAAVTGVMGTLHALEVAVDQGARIVLGTSPERFGHGVRCAESIALDFARKHRLDVRIVRVASAYGPRMLPDDPHVVAQLALRGVRGEDLFVGESDDAVPVRMSFVDDAVETLARTMRLDWRVPAVAAPYVDATVATIAHEVAIATGCDLDLDAVWDDAPKALADDAPARATTPDALPASIAFGQAEAVDLGDGIARTVRWFEQRLGLVARPRTSGIFELTPRRTRTASGEPAA